MKSLCYLTRAFSQIPGLISAFLTSSFLASAAAILPLEAVDAQVALPPPAAGDSVVAVPAEHCDAGSLWEGFAGKGYRDLWTTGIRVPVADLGELGGGGLTPMRVGGGMTTQTLHLRGADGRRYVFRSVEKDSRQGLPEEFWGTPVEAIFEDQLCSFHPSGAVIVSRLLDAVDVLHPEPQLMVVPDDPRLGEFRERFAGMLVLFEERPDDLPDGAAGFGGSDRIEQIEDFFSDLEDHAGDRVDLRDLLRARLIDLLVGDRDRSVNNFLWARYDEGEDGHLWRTIPRDRDQSFVRFDGPGKTLGRIYDPRLVAFDDEYSNTRAVTRNAWDMDRNLLVALDRESWDEVVQEVKSAITDGVIKEAVSRMPKAHFDLVGEKIGNSLRLRRDRLDEAADGLYAIVFREADIHGTDEDEVAILDRVDGGGVRVSLHLRGPGSEPPGPPHFQRTFIPEETQELRIYLHGGDDLVRVSADPDPRINLIIAGGGGNDELRGSDRKKVKFYDPDEGTIVEGDGSKWVRRRARRPYSWWADGEEVPDFGSMSMPLAGVAYDADRGFTPSIGILRDRYSFLNRPYGSRLRLKVGWAFGSSQPVVSYNHRFRSRMWGGDLVLAARYSGVDVVRFYGYGNATDNPEPSSYYEVDQNQLVASASISFWDGDSREITIGPVFRSLSTDTIGSGTFLAENQVYGGGDFLQAGLEAYLDLDTRDVKNYPSEGYHVTAGAAVYPSILGVDETYGEFNGQGAMYLSPEGRNPTLAMRAGGKHLMGTFPYAASAFLGGTSTVRGLPEQRYAGKSSFFGSAELRLLLTRAFFVFPFDLGVFGLADAGKVFMPDLDEGSWHTAFGGGVWLAPVVRDAALRFSLAQSDGDVAYYVGMGFAF